MKKLKEYALFILPVVGVIVIILTIVGYLTAPNSEEYSIWSIIYASFQMFALGGDEPTRIPWMIMLAKYLGAFFIGYSIILLIYAYARNAVNRIKVLLFYKNHSVIVGLQKQGFILAREFLKAGEKVVVFEMDTTNELIPEIEDNKGIVFKLDASKEKNLVWFKLRTARRIILLLDSDQENIETGNLIARKYQEKKWKHHLNTWIHIDGPNNLMVLKDYLGYYQDMENFQLNEFNISKSAARTLYDKFPPHHFMPQPLKGGDTHIAIVGFNMMAESFILENVILSHYPDKENITIWLYHPEATIIRERLLFKYPFLKEFINLHTVTSEDERFQHFSHPGILQPHPENVFNVSYIFSEDDSEALVMAKRFRQFLYAEYGDINGSAIITCMPETCDMVDLVNVRFTEHHGNVSLEETLQEDFNIQMFRLYTTTLHRANLVNQIELNEKIARVINYFYTIQYDFSGEYKEKRGQDLPVDKFNSIFESFLQIKPAGTDPIAALENATKKILAEVDPEIADTFGITPRWQILTDRKKDSNRYVARHLDVKLSLIGDASEVPEAEADILAHIEHKRWCAEELVLDYRFAEFPKNKKQKNLLKNDLKIHELIIPFDQLSDQDKKKDADIFRALPLLREIRNILIQEF